MKSTSSHSAKWNAADYATNSSVQHGWARELIARLRLRGDEHVLDVGCGDGKITAELARLLPRGSVLGADASAEMISFAKNRFPAAENPNLEFHVLDARKIKLGGRFDLVFSNAALHWVDDQQAFFQGAASVLKPGGRLAVSCGGKGNAHDVFLAFRPEMWSKRWRGFFRGLPRSYFFYAPGDYETWLPECGFKINVLKLVAQDIPYAGADGVATWLRTTWIPYVQRVPENLREEFIAAVTERYLAKNPPAVDGHVLVRMVRLEIEAVKT
jgi:trans-aconitate 2-methyltransferase